MNTGRPQPNYERALILHQQGRHADAANELRAGLANDPHNGWAHAMLALCLVSSQKYAEATHEAQTAIGLAPQMPFGHYAMSKVLYSRHFFDESASAIGEAIALDPYQADYHALLGFIRFEQNLWPAALEQAEHGLQIDPEHEACTNLRAMALVKLGRKEEASRTIEGALARDPDNAHTHANQGWTYLHRGDPKNAMTHFTEALRLDPTLDWARAGLVEALKARNFLYRWVLRYFLFMSRLGKQAQWGIIIGGWIGYRFAFNTAQNNPTLAPYLWPIVIAYIGFALLTWLAYPLFNLLLRLHPQGKFALSRDQRYGANVVAIVLICALASLGVWLKMRTDPPLLAALFLTAFLLPTSAIFKCPQGWPRWTMAGVTLLLGLLMTGSVVADCLDTRKRGADPFMSDLSDLLMYAYIYGVLIASFGSNWLISQRPRR